MCEYVFDKKQTISCLISRWSRQIRLCKRCWRECFYISTNTYVKIALMKNKKVHPVINVSFAATATVYF